MERGYRILLVVLSLSLVFMLSIAAMAQEIPKISKEELKGMLGKPKVILVDVRTGADWSASMSKIKGAVRAEPDKVDSWMNNYSKDQTLVFYCT
jgi:rhodanese-related sulfurtransferase